MKFRVDYAKVPLRDLGANFDGTTVAAAYLSYLWPQAVEYASPIPTVFLSRLNKLAQLKARPVWLVRDGIVLLQDFFTRFRPPSEFKRQLLIHESLAPWVPLSWRKYFRSYKIVSLAQFSSGEPDGIIVAGLNARGLVDQQRLRESIGQALAEIRGPLKRVMVVAPAFQFDNLDNSRFHYETIAAIAESCGKVSKFIAWQEVDQVPSLDRLVLVELNQRNLIADPYMTHYLLAKGARSHGASHISGETEISTAKLIPLSLRHGIVVGSVSGPVISNTEKEFFLANLALHQRLPTNARCQRR